MKEEVDDLINKKWVSSPTWHMSTMRRRVGGGMRRDWWGREVGTPVMSVKWSVGARNPRRNIGLALKKLDLRTWKTATDVGEKPENIEERATSSVKKPRHQGSRFGGISHTWWRIKLQER